MVFPWFGVAMLIVMAVASNVLAYCVIWADGEARRDHWFGPALMLIGGIFYAAAGAGALLGH